MKFINNKNPDVGFWKEVDESIEWYGHLVRCSKCGNTTLDDGIYCSQCGSKMFNGRKELNY